jgi:DNA-binding NarL/FixJ family response regulator
MDIVVIPMASMNGCVSPDRFDVLLLDSELAGDQPTLTDLRAAAVRTNVLVVVLAAGSEGSMAFLRVGAKGCIDYRATPEEVVEAVRAVGAGRELTAAPDECRISVLSPRERAVLSYIARGYTHDQTARRLNISRHTVDTYIRRARAKLNLGNKAELTRAFLNCAA